MRPTKHHHPNRPNRRALLRSLIGLPAAAAAAPAIATATKPVWKGLGLTPPGFAPPRPKLSREMREMLPELFSPPQLTAELRIWMGEECSIPDIKAILRDAYREASARKEAREAAAAAEPANSARHWLRTYCAKPPRADNCRIYGADHPEDPGSLRKALMVYLESLDPHELQQLARRELARLPSSPAVQRRDAALARQRLERHAAESERRRRELDKLLARIDRIRRPLRHGTFEAMVVQPMKGMKGMKS